MVGPIFAIGGKHFNRAERAIFAVYLTLFDIVGSLDEMLRNPSGIGSVEKAILKAANGIRRWA